MMVNDAASAAEYLREWGERAFNLNRCRRVAADMRVCANMCGDRRPVSRDGFLAAERVFLDAQAAHDAATGSAQA